MIAEERDLPARVYWTVLVVGGVLITLLYWFTSSFNLPLGDA